MKLVPPKVIELTEYESKFFPLTDIPHSAGVKLYENYHKQVHVEFPNYKTGNQWQLKAKGWVGYIPLTTEISLNIKPKVTIKNFFGMLEYAYHLKSFNFIEGLNSCESLEEFYQRLAYLLAQKIIERSRTGLYRTYISKADNLAYIRGRLDVRQAIKKPWDTKLKCHYQEYTADIEDNQILAWTLFIICRSGLCQETILSTIHQAYRTLHGLVSLKAFSGRNCLIREYNRLNGDYQLLHALCQFFLDNTGASHEKGNNTTLPFLVDMAQLYEVFVAEWFKSNLPPHLFIKSQEIIKIGNNLTFKTDLVIYDVATKKPRYIIDTKYSTKLKSEDIAQVATYALTKECQEVVLLYPTALSYVLNETIRDIRIRSLVFCLDKDINHAGQIFLQNLLDS